ncbi:2-polyprenyl-6-methoxyphenol hydroxylase, partial [Nocardia sp. NPDC019302]
AVKKSEFHSLGLVLGYAYPESPVVVSDGTAPPVEDPIEYTPSACPGALLPHVWLHDGRSLYDALGPEFTLVVIEDEAHRSDAGNIVARAAESSVPLTVLRLSDRDIADERSLMDIFGARLVLVRPDQHVAWRANDPAGGEKAIDVASGW